MPLTTITAWEVYDRLGLYSDTIRSNTVPPGTSTSNDSDKKRGHSPSSILIIGGAGVGSIAIQLAKNLVN